MRLSKADARRALVRHLFPRCEHLDGAFERLRSVQFDPISPAGGNHDLVLQERVPGYRIGDWEKYAYEDRRIYDGWDKQASLVPFEGWPPRRIFHSRHPQRFDAIFEKHANAVQAIVAELREKGPLMPSECETQEHKPEWKNSWHGPNLSKQVLRALWHNGQVMTSGRRRGQHVYDLTERVVPPEIYHHAPMTEEEQLHQLFLDRHRAIGILRPTASYEVWSYYYAPERAKVLEGLKASGEIVPVEVEGIKGHATPDFLARLDEPAPEARVTFVAPLDQLMWDRKLVNHVFEFDYIWEIYVPELKRKWGYYVLPVLFEDRLVARTEFWARAGVLEMKSWTDENTHDPGITFLEALAYALQDFMAYCSAKRIKFGEAVPRRIRDFEKSLNCKVAE